MADNQVITDSQHLTSLDFDISKIEAQLKSIETNVAETVSKIKNDPKYRLDLSVGVSSNLTSEITNQTKGIESALKSQSISTNELADSTSRLSKETTTYNEQGKELAKTQNIIHANLDQEIIRTKTLEDGKKSLTRTIVSDNDARDKLATTIQQKEVAAYNSELAVLDKVQKSFVSLNTAIRSADLEPSSFTEVTKQYEQLLQYRQQLVNTGIAPSEGYDLTQIKNTVSETEKVVAAIKARTTAEKAFDEKVYVSQVNSELKMQNEILKERQRLGLQSNKQYWIDEENRIKENSAQLKEQIELYEKTTLQVQNLINAQKQQVSQGSASSSVVNTKELESANKNLKELETLQTKIRSQGYVDDADISNLTRLQTETKKVNAEMKQATTSANGFMNTIADKARWLTAFYLIDSVKQAFFDTIDVIKDTEMAVVDLQRVLNDPSLGNVQIQSQLYSIAEDYGRIFDEVSDSATKFAQTGASWNETLALTEATMLAVNTAELEVETATTGLIAVMSQFNVETTDMIDVIDRINITADNFAVTSEKIVSALQRMGSAAVNANLSLEDSISLITSMSEATGRSGETIGTALNSLLVYSQRDTSLDIFASLNEEMANTVNEFRIGTLSITDLWTELSKSLATNDEMAKALSSQLEIDSMYQQFASTLENEAMELTDSIKETYETAGTHRQNYFIALLDNMDTYTEAMEGMSDAEGYSLSENEKYMDTLTAQYNSLIANVRELAVAFGEGGFLDFLKLLTQLGIGATDLVKQLGGLRSILVLVSAIFISLKSQQIVGLFSGMGTAIAKSASNFVSMGTDAKLAFDLLRNGALNSNNEMIKMSGRTVPELRKSLVSMATLGIGVALSAISAYTAKIEENKRKTEELISSYNDATNSLQTYISELRTLYNTRTNNNEIEINEQLLDLQEKITEATGIQLEQLDLINGSQSENLALLEQEYLTRLKLNAEQLRTAKILAEAESEQAPYENPFIFLTESLDPFIKDVNNAMVEAESLIGRSLGDTIGQAFDKILDAESAEEQAQLIKDAINIIVDAQREQERLAGEGATDVFGNPIAVYDYTDALSYLTTMLTEYDEKQNSASIATDNFNKALGEIALIENFNIGLVQTEKDFDALISKINEINETDITEFGLDELGMSVEETRSYLESLASQLTSFTATPDVFDPITYSAEEAATRIKTLSDSLDEAQSSFSTIYQAMDEYNNNGVFTIDMVQQLMSLSGQYASMLSFEGGQLHLVDSATGEVINSKNELIKQYVAEQTAAQIASLAESLLAEQSQETAYMQADAAAKSAMLSQELQNVAYNALGTAQGLYEVANAASIYASGMGLTEDNQRRFEEGVEQIFNNASTIYENIGSISNDPTVWGADGIESVNDMAREANEQRIEALEAQKDAIQSRYDAEIDALKEIQEENDRITAQEEYLKNLRDAQDDLASAQSRSGVDYREQEADALEKIAELEKDWQEQLRDWNIEDTISELEAMRDAEIAVLDAQIQALRDATSSMSSSVVSATGSAMSGMASTYSKTITQTSEETADEAYKTMENIAVKTFDVYANSFLAPIQQEYYGIFTESLPVIGNTFTQMYYMFKSNFINKSQHDLEQMFLSSASKFSTLSSIGAASSSYGNYSNTYNNGYNNVNSYINVASKSDINKIKRNIEDLF